MKRILFSFGLLTIISILSFTNAGAQVKKPLDHSVYDSWQSLKDISVPYNGRYVLYSVACQDGDDTLYMYDLQSDKTQSFPRGKRAVISANGEKMLYRISPTHSETHNAKVKKKKENEMPKDTLTVLNLKSGEKQTVPNLKTVKYGKELEKIIAFQTEEKTAKKDSSANALYVMNIESNIIDTIKFVEKYDVRYDGEYVAYITKPVKGDSITKRGLYLYNVADKSVRTLIEGEKKMKIELPSFEEDGSRLAFYAQPDTAKAQQKFSNIYLYDISSSSSEGAKILISNDIKGLKEGWMIAGGASVLSFANKKSSVAANGGALIFRTKPIPEEKDTTVAEFERVKLDIWKWDADYLPTVVEVRKKEFENISYAAVLYFAEPEKMVQLADEQIPSLNIPDELKGDYILASTDKPYRVIRQWVSDPHCDYYKINLRTGERTLVKKDVGARSASCSPSGKYYLWYNCFEKNWFIFNINSGDIRNLTADIEVPFYDEDSDVPGAPGAYSFPMWMEDESYFLLGDRYDLWKFDPTDVIKPYTITENTGRLNEERYKIIRLVDDPSSKTTRMGMDIKPLKKDEPVYLSSFNRKTRQTGFYVIDITKKKYKTVKLAEGPFTYSIKSISLSNEYPGLAEIGKSNKPPRKRSVPVYIYTKENFRNSPNVYITKDLFRTETKITETNPQQKDYNWGSVEMVSWYTADSIKAEGLLFKPENFNPSKKYPLMVYFYEKYSDDLYRYREPAPSRSIVNIPYFVSNEYIVFVPDIYYTDGHPGQCAMRSIMPGVDMLCENPWINSEKMAIQGQSWGGYQVAYMITQTDRFAAAGAGAPVSNMTSAYGGIRWGSGVTRQMQYEQGQSRIGKNLWDGFDLYYENSPLFFAPNVKTPVLIMHNDKDTAVPWYQGIEYFAALRRLGKQAWMLQYKGEDHNLRLRHNCKDLSEKLSEFFDYYLKDAPCPDWMKNE